MQCEGSGMVVRGGWAVAGSDRVFVFDVICNRGGIVGVARESVRIISCSFPRFESNWRPVRFFGDNSSSSSFTLGPMALHCER